MGSIDKACISGFLCRLCSEMHRIVIHIYGDQGQRLCLVEKINGYLPITISPTDPLPKTICTTCLRRVEQHYDLLMRLSRIKEEKFLRIDKQRRRRNEDIGLVSSLVSSLENSDDEVYHSDDESRRRRQQQRRSPQSQQQEQTSSLATTSASSAEPSTSSLSAVIAASIITDSSSMNAADPDSEDDNDANESAAGTSASALNSTQNLITNTNLASTASTISNDHIHSAEGGTSFVDSAVGSGGNSFSIVLQQNND